MDEEILIVEDEMITAEAIKEILQNMYYKVTGIAASGEDAIKIIHDHPPNLILMDIVLKGDINGIEAARRISLEFDIPIIFLTAYGDIDTINEAKRTEPFGYIIKPITNENDLRPNIELALYNHNIKKQLKFDKETLNRIKKVMVSNQGKDIINNGKNNDINNEYYIDASGMKNEQNNQRIKESAINYLSKGFEVLSNKERSIIISNLKNNNLKLPDIQNLIKKSQSTTSHHLKQLESIDFITGIKDGKFTLYSLQMENVQNFFNFWMNWFQIQEEDYRKETTTQLDLDILIKKLDYLASKERISILSYLLMKSMPISELAILLKKSQSTISHHIKILQENNFISKEKEEKSVLYSVFLRSIIDLYKFFRKLYL